MSFRIEEKLFVKRENLIDFKKFLEKKSVKQIYHPRIIKSLYFDNINLDMYADSKEGLTPRKKIRVRNYPNDLARQLLFETKISSVEGRFKTNRLIKEEDFKNLKKNGIFDCKYGICKPVLNVNYIREYFKKDDVRITLDSNIFYRLHNTGFIKKDLQIIVELKTSINKNLDELFEIYPYQEIRFSKYCNGLELFSRV